MRLPTLSTIVYKVSKKYASRISRRVFNVVPSAFLSLSILSLLTQPILFTFLFISVPVASSAMIEPVVQEVVAIEENQENQEILTVQEEQEDLAIEHEALEKNQTDDLVESENAESVKSIWQLDQETYTTQNLQLDYDYISLG